MKKFKVYNTVSELTKELDEYYFRQFHIHHTWKPEHANFRGDNHQAMQNGMRNYHLGLGWSDIGQHITLFPDGKILKGRDYGMVPASIKGWNSGAFMVEMIGNFDKGHDKLQGKQKQAILELIKYFKGKGTDIKFHREGPGVSKTCPGTSLDKQTLINEAMNMKGSVKVTKQEIQKMIDKSIKEAFGVNDEKTYKNGVEAIKSVKAKGIMAGDPNGKFRPNEPVKRVELAIALNNIYDKLK